MTATNIENFKFDGNWEYEVMLSDLAGFQERKGSYTSISSDRPNRGIFRIEFQDDLSDNPDPLPEQLNTLQFIFANQKLISDKIIDRTLQELPEIIINYDLQTEKEFQNLNRDKVKSIIGFSTIHIKIVSKDNYAYFDMVGGCNWDEEHGLNVLFHKERVISFGGIDGSSSWVALKDCGADDQIKDVKTREAPKKYYPHPKYNKLKPSQKFANETYEHSLISGEFNAQFINGVESGEIDINGKWESQDKTFLESACWFNNNEIVEFLLSKKANIRYALHQCVGYNNNPAAIELLLKNGADINYQYGDGNTMLFVLVSSLAELYRPIDYYTSNNKIELITEELIQKINNSKSRIKMFISIGADPYIKNKYEFNCFDIMRNSSETSRKDVNDYLNKCLKEK